MKKILDVNSSKPFIITAALPYANGRLHIGHIVEYVQADIYARFLRLAGVDAKYYCASDTHGTPIEVKAQELKISPDELVQKNHEHNKTVLQKYGVNFESFHATNSSENKELTEWFWGVHLSKGLLYTKQIELSYCNNCKRFLPDRFVKGNCPKCGAPDQYGDVCEKCNGTHKTIDLKNPYCVICKKSAGRKNSEHHFFKLSAFKEPLANWLSSNKNLQSEVVNQVMVWVDQGLDDWCITRDEPYYGFKVPGIDNKYVYVWYDAPIGYISSVANASGSVEQGLKKWKSSRITHVIGKDILYFHFLFWPAMLHGAGLQMPDNVTVHGHLKWEGEKLSKSRGTLIDADDFLKLTSPEFLRFYYAYHLSKTMNDIDFTKDSFLKVVNTELIANIANYCYRVLSFCSTKLGGKISVCDSSDVQKKILEISERVLHSYARFDFREAVRGILEIGSVGNTYLQDKEPWKVLKDDEDLARKTITTAVNISKIISILIKPIIPEFSRSLEDQIGAGVLSNNDINFKYENKTVSGARIIFQRVDSLEINTGDSFSSVDLKVAKILSVDNHPTAEKLYVLNTDLGSENKVIVAGLRKYYSPEELLGRNIVVVANLEPATLRGVKSNGMLLASIDKKGTPRILSPTKSSPGDDVFIDGAVKKAVKQITIEEYSSLGIKVFKGRASYKSSPLKTIHEEIIADAPEESLIG
ncbi:methionine--tRNA ligase [Candidatus Woesearchaeota archaeon]|nr:methionine--tRNA ligase [Candidatus Woesearchaeota archaeon]